MAYVLEVISKDGKIKYINSAKATVYCPEYAARYDDKKTAMTVAAAHQTCHKLPSLFLPNLCILL